MYYVVAKKKKIHTISRCSRCYALQKQLYTSSSHALVSLSPQPAATSSSKNLPASHPPSRNAKNNKEETTTTI